MKENIFFTEKHQIGETNQPIKPIQKMKRGAKVDELKDIKDIASALRDYVKKKYPKYKFAVNIERFSGGQALRINWFQADFNPLVSEEAWGDTKEGKRYTINESYIESNEKLTPKAKSVLQDVVDFYEQYNYDFSEPQSDYYNVRFYTSVNIGTWSKPFEQVSGKPAKPTGAEQGAKKPKFDVGQSVRLGTIEYSRFVKSKNEYIYGVRTSTNKLLTIWESNISSKANEPLERAKVTAFALDDNGNKIERTEVIYRDNILFEGLLSPDEIKEKYETFWKGNVVVTKVVMNGIETLYNQEIPKDTENDPSDEKPQDQPEFRKPTTTMIDGFFEIMNEDISFKNWDELKNKIAEINSKIKDKNLHWRLPTMKELETYFFPNKSKIPNLTSQYLSSEIVKIEGTNNGVQYYNLNTNFRGQVWLSMSTMYNARLVRNNSKPSKPRGAEQDENPQDQPELPTHETPLEIENEAIAELDDELILINELRKENFAQTNLEAQKEFRDELTELISARDIFTLGEFNFQKSIKTYFERISQPVNFESNEQEQINKRTELIANYVKTNAFKNWFGDWQNPKYPCSQAVKIDPTSDKRVPLIVYHGTQNPEHFTRFKTDRFPIIYFAENPKYAQWFADLGNGKIFECFLDIRFPVDFRALQLQEITWQQLSIFLKDTYGIILPTFPDLTEKRKVWQWIRFDGERNFTLLNAIKDANFDSMIHVENNPQQIDENGNEEITDAYMIFDTKRAKLVKYAYNVTSATTLLFLKKGGLLDLKREIKSL